MKVRAVLTLTLCLCLSSVAAHAATIVGPDTAETGVPYIPWIFDEFPSSCHSWSSMEVTEEPLTMIVNITLDYSNPNPGLPCIGIAEQWEIEPEFVFPYPGTWTIRVEQRTLNFGDPEHVSVTAQKEIVVTGAVPTPPVSFSTVKALYR